MGERIVGVALMLDDGAVLSLLPPYRHGTLCSWHWDHRLGVVTPEQQGFLTSTGRFVRRVEAKKLATEAKQILPGEGKHPELFSEDLW